MLIFSLKKQLLILLLSQITIKFSPLNKVNSPFCLNTSDPKVRKELAISQSLIIVIILAEQVQDFLKVSAFRILLLLI